MEMILIWTDPPWRLASLSAALCIQQIGKSPK